MCFPAWHLNPLSRHPSQAFRPLRSLCLLRYQSTDSHPKHATISWENVSIPWKDILVCGESGQKKGKDCKNSPQNPGLLSCLNWEPLLCQKELTTYHSLGLPSLQLGYIILLIEISIYQNPTHQMYISTLAEQFDKLWQRWRWHAFDLVILFLVNILETFFA